MNEKSVKTILEHIKAIAINNNIYTNHGVINFLHTKNGGHPRHFSVSLQLRKDYVRLTLLTNDGLESFGQRPETGTTFSLISALNTRLVAERMYIDRYEWNDNHLVAVDIRQSASSHHEPKEFPSALIELRHMITHAIWDELEIAHEPIHGIADFESIFIDYDDDTMKFVSKGFTYKTDDLSTDRLADVLKDLTKEKYYKVDGEEFSELFDAHQALHSLCMESIPVGTSHNVTWRDNLTLVIDEGTETEKVFTITELYR